MKTTYGWVGGNGTNTSVFSGLPGGLCGYFDGIFDYAGLEGYWWSSSPFSSDAWCRGLDFYIENVVRYYSNRRFGFSVRCVRDAE